ncbi:MAG: M3 family metallopeptidase [Nocardioidaceae bacterium]|nr:M3 family metallopeptidase [Nocardioidaceae bacterium]
MAHPLLGPSDLPYRLPRFADFTDDAYAPAIEEAMASQRAAVDAIVADPAPPTFVNTLEPLETSGLALERVLSVFFNKASADTDDVVDALQVGLAPRLAAHEDAITLDSALFARIRAVAEEDGLDAEQRYLVDRRLAEMTLAGAGLAEDDKARLKQINEQLSAGSTAFQIALKTDSNDLAVHVQSADELDGLTAGEVSAAREAARARGLDGYLLTLVLPTSHPHLASLTDRDLRRRLHDAQRARGSRGNEHDTRQVYLDVVRLRAERARLLGFRDHASVVTADNTAKTPEAVREMLARLAPAAARNARLEHQQLSAKAGFRVEAWDWPFYAAQVRAEEYDVDLAALRPWFEAERVLREGVFRAATLLFGITFTERPDLDGYHPDVRVFEVKEEDGTPVGLYLLDLYTRDSKRGGAWMSSFVRRAALVDEPTAVVFNNLNVPKPAPGDPTLLTFDETSTLFHEFGHALHGLLAEATYPKLAGTAVFRDFVEYPSQVNEMWMLWPSVLERYAVHHDTGEAIPAEVVERIEASRTFNEGFATSEYLAAALLDLAWHELAPEDVPQSVDEVAGFEAEALAAVGLDDPAVPARYSTPYFQHSATHYGSAYYSYIWSEVLAADTTEWYEQNGGPTRENGDSYRRHVIGIGGTRDPLESYREWRGRAAPLEPLLRQRGLE